MIISTPTQSTSGPAFVGQKADDFLYVTSTGAAVGAPGQAGVELKFEDNGVDNDGTIFGAVGIVTEGKDDTIYNSASGQIVGIVTGIEELLGSGTDIVNAGYIHGSTVGIDCDEGPTNTIENSGSISGRIGIIVGSPTVSIDNSGLISGQTASIQVDGKVDTAVSHALNLHNAGTIDGDIAAGVFSLNLLNSGVIRGDITLAGAHNVIGGLNGTIDGSITGGDGGNTFNLSHQTVTGMISGGAGDDVIIGTAGDDVIEGGLGKNYLDGGPGNNTASYADAEILVTVDLLFPSKNGGDASGDTLVHIQNLIGSGGPDTLLGDMGDNVLSGGGGSDILYGRGGNDSVDGGSGNDLIYAGSGNGHYEGGDGSDSLGFQNIGFGVTISLAAQGSATQSLGSSTIVIDGFENLSGSSFGDTLTGDGNANYINGGSGDDHINGGLGNDTILGGAGNDTLIGGGGVDTVSYADATAGVTVSLAKTAQQNTVGSGLDTISGFANLTGSHFNDTLIGNTGNNTFSGLGGHDTFTGGGGHDTFAILGDIGGLVTVTDFSPVDDIFTLSRSLFRALPAGTTLAGSAFYKGAAAHDPDDHIIYDNTSGNIYYDDDGNGPDAAIEIAHIGTDLALTAANFHLYEQIFT